MDSENYIGEKIGDGWIAEVYARDDKAIKLFKRKNSKPDAFYEALISTIVETIGLPVPKIFGVYQICDRWAIEMELLKGSMVSTIIKQHPAEITKYIDSMVDLHIKVHSIKNLPVLVSQKKHIEDRIQRAEALSSSKKESLISGLSKMPDMNCLCHGDFHYNNLIMSGEEICIIDWIDAVLGNPAADVCRTYLLYKLYSPEIAEIYIEKYSSKSEVPLCDIMSWLPFVAAARLSEGNGKEVEQLLEWI